MPLKNYSKSPVNQKEWTRVIEPSTIHWSPTKHDQDFNLCINKTSSLYTILSLDCQTVQKMYMGLTFQILCLSLLRKETSQSKTKSLAESGIAQETPNKEKKIFHNILAFVQWRRRWSGVSSLSWQRGQWLAKSNLFSSSSHKLGS